MLISIRITIFIFVCKSVPQIPSIIGAAVSPTPVSAPISAPLPLSVPVSVPISAPLSVSVSPVLAQHCSEVSTVPRGIFTLNKKFKSLLNKI